MAITTAIIGAVVAAGEVGAGAIEASNQQSAAKAQMAQQANQQKQLYSTLTTQQQDQENQANAVNARNQAEGAEAQQLAANKGASSTILTSPLGIPNTSNSTLGKATLLGA